MANFPSGMLCHSISAKPPHTGNGAQAPNGRRGEANAPTRRSWQMPPKCQMLSSHAFYA